MRSVELYASANEHNASAYLLYVCRVYLVRMQNTTQR